MTSQSPAQPDRALEDDLRLAGRMGALGGALGGLGGVLLWAASPEYAGDPTVAVAGIASAFAVSLACLLIPWDRVSQRWVLLPILAGIVLTAVACWNSPGPDSPYAAFYVFLAAMAGYFATRPQVRVAVGMIVVAAGLPVIYETAVPLVERIEGWGLRASLAVGTAMLLQHARERARDSAARLRAMAMQDPLTGIANRRAFELRAAAEAARARRHGGEMTVAFVDLDGFKAINDAEGHTAGDRLLRRVAHAVEGAVRGEDFVGRLGGDEFGVLLPSAGDDEAAAVLARIDAAVRRVSAGEGGPEASLSASSGSASFPRDGATLDELLDVADDRLRAVKAARLGRPHPVRERAAPASADGDVLFPGGRAPAASAAPAGAVRRLVFTVLTVIGMTAAYLAAGPLGVAGVARPALTVAACLALAVAAVFTSRRTEGRERAGWVLLAVAAAIAPAPFAGPVAGIVFAAGLVLVAGVRPQTRSALLDGASLLALIATCVVAFAALPVLEHTDAETSGVIGGSILLTVSLWSAVAVVFGTRVRERPDVWLLAAGFALGGVAAVPQLFFHFRAGALPTETWQVGLPLSPLLLLGAATLRTLLPARAAREGRPLVAGPRLTLAGIVLFMAPLTTVVVVYDGIPLALAPLLLVTIALRALRVYVTETENERLVGVARRSREQIADQYRATLLALGATLEARDGYTARHGDATVTLVARVARRLGLAAAQVEEVATVARLHDIGKIGVPNEILLKPGPLTPEEWEVMRQHPVIGERILCTVPGLGRVAEAVRHEHERWDGTGYPDGLAGEAIPLASRLVLVCDAYHAMTSDRPYRAALSAGAAADELRRGAGSQFDPAVVHALLAELEAPVVEDEAGSPAAALAYQASS